MLVYPQQHPKGVTLHRPPASDLHETAGLPGNWALDFMAPGGTRVLAVEAGEITRLSGHNPDEGVIDGDIFGWNVYLTTPAGRMYFYTHLGNRDVRVGEKVNAGTIIGHVGHWPGDEPRSHTHLGVTHPDGEQASKEWIVKVSKAVEVSGHWVNP